MKKLLALVLVMVLVVALTLAAVIVLVAVTIRISVIASPIFRAVAVGGELFVGIGWLLGTIYLSTHLVVRIFGRGSLPPV